LLKPNDIGPDFEIGSQPAAGWFEISHVNTPISRKKSSYKSQMFPPGLVGGFNHLEKYESQWEG